MTGRELLKELLRIDAEYPDMLDHENILVAQIAKHIFNVPKVVCHLGSPQLQVLYAALGLDVVGYSFGLLQDVRQAIEG